MPLVNFAAWVIMYATGGLHVANASACTAAIQTASSAQVSATDVLAPNLTALEEIAADYPSGLEEAWFIFLVPQALELQATLSAVGA
jgi:hypothetical protein